MLISICRNNIKITRLTSELFSTQGTASTITVDNTSPNVKANVQVQLNRPSTGLSNTLTVTIAGNVKVDSQESTYTTITEDLSFLAPLGGIPTKVMVTSKNYSNITSFSMSGSAIADGFTISANYIGPDGGNIFSQSVIVDGYPAAITRSNEKWPDKKYGSASSEGPSMLLPYTDVFEIRIGDIVTNKVTNEEYMVVGVPLIESFIGNQFRKVKLEKRNKSLQ